jgi:protein SCO1
VSVDPERDTAPVLAEYMRAFDPRIVGLTGTTEEVEAMARAYRVYFRKVPLESGGYTMDHTAAVYMMDAKGRFVGTISPQEPKEQALAKLRRLAG